jgi:hypothetical protein
MKKKAPPPTESFDYELAKQKVKEQFRTGKSLYGKDGAFAPLLQDMLVTGIMIPVTADLLKSKYHPDPKPNVQVIIVKDTIRIPIEATKKIGK